MSEHLSEQSIGQETLAWCNSCNRPTRRDVFRVAIGSKAGKPGPCKEHGASWLSKDQQKRRAETENARRNPTLFRGDE
jgi:hypothetical protein